MRTLLRNTKVGVYFRSAGQWTLDYRQAHDFKLIDQALKYIERTRLEEMELVFAFDNPPSITGVPIERVAVRYAEEAA
jgi:hypothetical protein